MPAFQQTSSAGSNQQEVDTLANEHSTAAGKPGQPIGLANAGGQSAGGSNFSSGNTGGESAVGESAGGRSARGENVGHSHEYIMRTDLDVSNKAALVTRPGFTVRNFGLNMQVVA